MIKIAGSVQRFFIFPADLRTAFVYYTDMQNTFSHLRHISQVKAYGADGYRMLFSTTELGIYHVRLYCDLKAEIDAENWILRVKPLEGVEPAATEAGLNSLTAPGYFVSQSLFYDEGEQTRIDYTLNLSGTLPVPLGLSFMPDGIVNAIAKNITQWRFRETVDHFIDQSVRQFSSDQ